MNKLYTVNQTHGRRGTVLAAFLILIARTAYAAPVFVDNSPHQTTDTQDSSYLILIGFLLALSAVMFFIFHRRYHAVSSELKDIWTG